MSTRCDGLSIPASSKPASSVTNRRSGLTAGPAGSAIGGVMRLASGTSVVSNAQPEPVGRASVAGWPGL